MNPYYILLIIALYFGLLIVISRITGREDSNEVFFRAKREAPWYLVAFGMIGASLSGITFISVPGWVEAKQFSYLQMVLGFVVGYFVIAYVLLPVYYRMNLTSIYSYLGERFGTAGYKTGSVLFLIARVMGASLRLFLVAGVLQMILFDKLGVPFWLTVSLTIVLIWVYTSKGGIKTIIVTDTLQTAFMLGALVLTIILIGRHMNMGPGELVRLVRESPHSRVFFFDDVNDPRYFWKLFLAGVFIAIAMTGLDQGMMQKNLTVKTLKDSQKNMRWFSIALFIVNVFFLALGVILLAYADFRGWDLAAQGIKGDKIFPHIAVETDLGFWAALLFVLGLISAAYSSADSSMTAITTSFSIDILDLNKRYPPDQRKRIRKLVHIGVSVFFIIILLLYSVLIKDQSIINSIFTFASYTYGPLLGLFAFGLFSKRRVRPWVIPVAAVVSPVLTYGIAGLPERMGWAYKFGFELLLVNAAITMLLLWLGGLGYQNKK
ncbi:MAG: sodium:solute symporter [Chlorobi bacterium]|nr:sodium:solute symporter [Chlorobiota bacterium]